MNRSQKEGMMRRIFVVIFLLGFVISAAAAENSVNPSRPISPKNLKIKTADSNPAAQTNQQQALVVISAVRVVNTGAPSSYRWEVDLTSRAYSQINDQLIIGASQTDGVQFWNAGSNSAMGIPPQSTITVSGAFTRHLGAKHLRVSFSFAGHPMEDREVDF